MPHREVDLRQLEQFCNELLRDLGSFKPSLSAEITRLCRGPTSVGLSPLQKKILKLRMLAEKDRPLFDALLSDLNRTEFKGPRSPANFIDLAERLIPEFNFWGEMTGGNFRRL